jgi:hypothetical protein
MRYIFSNGGVVAILIELLCNLACALKWDKRNLEEADLAETLSSLPFQFPYLKA